MPTEGLLQLADLLDKTADHHEQTAAVIAEYIDLDDVVQNLRKLGGQMRVTAGQIREGRYDAE